MTNVLISSEEKVNRALVTAKYKEIIVYELNCPEMSNILRIEYLWIQQRMEHNIWLAGQMLLHIERVYRVLKSFIFQFLMDYRLLRRRIETTIISLPIIRLLESHIQSNIFLFSSIIREKRIFIKKDFNFSNKNGQVYLKNHLQKFKLPNFFVLSSS